MSKRRSQQLPEGVTVEDFILAWQTSDDVDSVLAKLGRADSPSFQRLDATQFAGFLRRHDVPLKKYTPRRLLGNYDDLREMALKALASTQPPKA